MRNLKKYFIMALLVPVALTFQNCQEFEAGSANAPSTSITPTAPNPDVPERVFLAGQAVDSTLLPFNVSDETRSQIDSYLNTVGFKAIAFADNGELVARITTDATSQLEATQIVLEVCQLHNENRPCAVFAEGNTVKYDEAVFFDQFVRAIVDIDTLNISQIPALANVHKQTLSERYPDPSQMYDAIAINGLGGVYRGWSNTSQYYAEKRALEFCEAPSDRPCMLYAVGDSVVLDLENLDFSEKYVPYAPEAYDPLKVPFIDGSRVSDATLLEVNRVNNGTHYAVAISRYGHWRSVESQNPITQNEIQTVVDLCTASITRPPGATGYQHVCFLYAVDNQVVMTREAYETAALGR